MFWRALGIGLCILATLCSTSASSQTITFSVKDEGLERVFKLIEQQSGYYFTYTHEQISSAPKITLTIKNESITAVIDQCLKGLPLTYEISGKEVILKTKITEQDEDSSVNRKFDVTGRVVDALDGNPLAGAVIFPNGSQAGVIADKDGFFTLTGVSRNAFIVVSFVNYLPFESTIGDGKHGLIVFLRRESRTMDSVVVNTGLYRRPVENFTGAASTMSGEELRTANPNNVLKAIATLDPSFRITENNAMGSNPNVLPVIQIRGQNNLPSSLAGTGAGNIPASVSQGDIMSSYLSNPNQPLIIIDGFQSTLQALYDLDLSRIERVTLLKDAAAAVAYGSKSANGVIVVETKRPVSGKLQVTYSFNVNVQAPDLSSYHLLNASGLLQAQQYAGIFNDPNGNQANNIALQQWYNERLYNVQRGVNTDWLAQPVRTGVGSSHNLMLSGGTNDVRFGLTLSYANNEGVMKGSSRDAYTINNYLAYNSRRFKISDNAALAYGRSDNSPWGSFSGYAKQFPYFSPYDSTGHIAKILEPSALAIGSPSPAPGGVFTNAMYNSTLAIKDYTSYLTFSNAVNMEWVITHNLRLSGGINIVSQLPGADQYYPADYTGFLSTAPATIADLGSYTQTRGRNSVFDSRVGLDFNKHLGFHTLYLSVGGSAQSTSSDATTITVNGIPNDNLGQLGMANGYNSTDIKPTEGFSRTRSASLYGSASYNYRERYTAEATVNGSGSSQFGSNNRLAPFFAYGAGWNIDKESFFHPNSVIQALRLRATYGVTGNQNFAAFLGQPVYQYNLATNYRLQPGSYLQGYANPDLKWQQTGKMNFGLQASMLNSRLNVSGNYYIENTNNLILPLGIEPSTGFSSYLDNLGATSNKGYEVSLTGILVRDQKKNIFWSLTFNTGHYTNVITRLSPAIAAINNANNSASDQTAPLPKYVVGQSMSQIWAVPSLGIDPATGNELFRKLDGTTSFIWSAADERPVGDATSKFKGAFGSNLVYKGFVLNVMMAFEYGGQMYNQTLADLVENVNLLNTNADSRVLSERWKQPGDHVPFKALALNAQTTNATSRFVQDNNFLNASSITAGYNFPAAPWTKRLHLSSPRLFITQNDVFRLSTIRLERGTTYPFARNFSFGASAAF